MIKKLVVDHIVKNTYGAKAWGGMECKEMKEQTGGVRF